MTKIYLPMVRDNEFGIALIEKNPIKREDDDLINSLKEKLK